MSEYIQVKEKEDEKDLVDLNQIASLIISEDEIQQQESNLLNNNNQQTHWKRVRYPQEQTLSPPWTLKYIEGQGYAAFATRDIEPGELICIETPVFWIKGHHPFSKEQMDELIKKVKDLSEDDQLAYYAMANVYPLDKFPNEVGIFMTNCFDMTDSIFGECSAMYLALARLNHSCSPNVQQTHDPTTTEEYVYSVKYIKKGVELNDCYIDLRQEKAKRREELLKNYYFECTCSSCLLEETDPKSFNEEELYRKKCNEISEKTLELIENKRFKEALSINKELVKKLERDHIDWSIRYLAEIYLNLYYISFYCNDKKSAKKSLKKCLKLNEFTQGKKSPDSIKTKKLLDELEKEYED